jgi:hypothetical protein
MACGDAFAAWTPAGLASSYAEAWLNPDTMGTIDATTVPNRPEAVEAM